MTDQLPSVGQIVHYRLTEQDVSNAFLRTGRGGVNQPQAGDTLPMIIVWVSVDHRFVAGNVHLPGGHLLGVEGVHQLPPGEDGYGQWFWPPRV